jgi:hypothetical protein
VNKLSRGDAVVLAGAALLALSSLLPFYESGYGDSVTAWHWGLLPVLVLGFLAGVAAGVLLVLDRFTSVGDISSKIGFSSKQLSTALVVVSAAQLVLTVLPASMRGVGQWLSLVAVAALLVGTVFADRIPALSQPLVPAGPVAGAPVTGAGQQPFWFSVPVSTPVHDRADGTVRYTLEPGRWYLATASYGTSVEVTDEAQGPAILHDLSVMQRA